METTKAKESEVFSLGDLAKRYKQLPEEISELLFDPNIGKTIKNAMIVGNLPQEKFSDIMYLVSLVLIGFYHHEDFVQYFAEDIGADALMGQKVALEIDKKIFFPRKQTLDKLFDLPLDGFKDDTEENKLKETTGLGKFVWPLENKSSENKPVEKVAPLVEFKPKIFPREIDNSSATAPSIAKTEQKPTEQSVVAEKAVNPSQPKPALIFGAKTEIKPTLESKPAITSVFDEVKSKQEKPVISELESGSPVGKIGSLFQSFKNKLSFGSKGSSAGKLLEETKNKPLVPAMVKSDILPAKPTNISVEKKSDNQPIIPTKVVNYSAAEEKKPASVLNLNEEKKPVVVAPSQQTLAPVSKEATAAIPAVPVEKKPEKMDDKIVDLKKIKF